MVRQGPSGVTPRRSALAAEIKKPAFAGFFVYNNKLVHDLCDTHIEAHIVPRLLKQCL
jgi:hypothetical protein